MPSNPVIPAPSHAVAPATICLLRLSALGDATHVVPLVRTLRRAWPGVALTWVIGKGEYRLLEGLEGVEVVVYDKKTGLAGMRALRRQFGGRRFDALLQMQVAARATCCRRSCRRSGASATTARARRTCTGCSSTSASPTGPGSTCSTPSAAFASRWD